MDRCIENVIEFIENEDRATVTFSQGRYKSRIKRLAAEHPEECQIAAENEDGSLCAHIPVAWVKISPLREVSQEQREMARERMCKYHSEHGNALDEKG